MSSEFESLPPDLPVPEDDGAADHLQGTRVPSHPLVATSGQQVDLGSLPGLSVVYAYPMTGRPGVPLPRDWEATPGARGCTPQACAFRDRHADLRDLGASVHGLSTQATSDQREAKERLHLPFELLSDQHGTLARTLRLPTFAIDGDTYLERLTMVLEDGVIRKVFYPVFPPQANPDEVIAWLGARGTSSEA